jgi:hypothetical protein
MGKLQIVYRIRLASPAMLCLDTAARPAIAQFPETGNTVRIEPSQYGPAPDQPTLEGSEQMALCVERECTDEQGSDLPRRVVLCGRRAAYGLLGELP